MNQWLTQPVATLGAGMVVAVAAIITFVSAWFGRRQDRHHFAVSRVVERQRDLRRRYTTTASQLGDVSPAIRLAGAYALVGLADEWFSEGSRPDSQMTIDLLRAYLRVKPPTADYDEQEREVRKTILLEFSARSDWWNQARDRPSPVAVKREDCKRELQFALKRLRHQRRPKSVRGRWQRIRSFLVLYRNMLICMINPGALAPRCKRTFKSPTWKDMNTDLSGTYFAHVGLPGARLAGVHLSSADLSGADLRSADLEIATLSSAVLVDANLVDAYARDAILEFADLRRADLRLANLGGTDLSGANLAGADLRGAKLTNVIVAGANFTGAMLDGKVHDELKDRGAILDDPDWVANQHDRYPQISTPGREMAPSGGAGAF